MHLKIKIVLRSINVIPETKLAPQWPSSKASQAAKAANSLPKPSQTQPTANPPKPTAYSQTSLSPVKSGPTGSSQRSFCFLSWPMGKGPWDDQQQNRQHETSKKKENNKALQFSPICSQIHERNWFASWGGNRGASICDWAELWAPTCCPWVRNILV